MRDNSRSSTLTDYEIAKRRFNGFNTYRVQPFVSIFPSPDRCVIEPHVYMHACLFISIHSFDIYTFIHSGRGKVAETGQLDNRSNSVINGEKLVKLTLDMP